MLAAMVLLITIGIITICATGNSWQKQLFYAVGGLFAMIAVNTIDYRRLGAASYWIYALILALLAILLLDKLIDMPFVPLINGTRRWIKVGAGGVSFQIQPSEFCKIAYILALAWYLRFRSNYRRFRGLLGPFILTLLAMILILKEPDLGTVLLMMPILFSMLFVAGAKVKHLIIVLLLAIAVSPLMWSKMNLYQRQRISSVLLQNSKIRQKCEENPVFSQILTGKKHFSAAQWKRGRGWQLENSKYAIASGGLTGYGLGKGPYVKYGYLPERHNDFIFAIIAHQWGFLGCMAVLALYAVIIACGVEIAWLNTEPFARLVSVGIVAMFAVEVIVNISMTVGLMPVTGLTLPFISYGGSSLVVSMIAIGLLNNIGKHRPFTVAGRGLEGRRK